MNATATRNAQAFTDWATRSMKFNYQFGDVAAQRATIRSFPAAQLFSDGTELCAVSLAATTEGV